MLNLSNRFAYLSSVCEECELSSCACSQFTETVNDGIQVTGTHRNISFPETVNMVAAQQQDTYYTYDNLHVSASMRPSGSDIVNTILSSDNNLINDTCVSYASFSGADISVSNQTPTEQESSYSDSSLSTGSHKSSSVYSSQGSDNTFNTVHNLSDVHTVTDQFKLFT